MIRRRDLISRTSSSNFLRCCCSSSSALIEDIVDSRNSEEWSFGSEMDRQQKWEKQKVANEDVEVAGKLRRRCERSEGEKIGKREKIIRGDEKREDEFHRRWRPRLTDAAVAPPRKRWREFKVTSEQLRPDWNITPQPRLFLFFLLFLKNTPYIIQKNVAHFIRKCRSSKAW